MSETNYGHLRNRIAAAAMAAALFASGGRASAQEVPTATAPKKPSVSHQTSAQVKARHDSLRRAFDEQAKRRAASIAAPATAKAAAPASVPAPERRSLAEGSTVSFRSPDEVRSANGELRVTLVAMKAHGFIGDDPVFLRSYNGSLVGPTLRAKPGDVLRITLKNDLEPEVHHTGEFNTIHQLNTTNLHTHGLHVSPNGTSDNVLLEVHPKSTQEYEIKIPDNHVAGTFWYHAHRHGSTAVQVGSGMSGALVIEGGVDAVPEIKAAKERVFILQQIPYAYKNTITIGPPTAPQTVTYDLPEGVIEGEQADVVLSPNVWNQLGRFTTINGARLPVIRVRPGAVERWRFVHSGTRDLVTLKLERAKGSTAPDTLKLGEIARDGIPLGKTDNQPSVDLYPGYRSDILFKAPDEAGCEYFLVDDFAPAAKSIPGEPKPRRFLARVVVEGDPNPMNLPADAQLAGFRPPSLGAPTEAVTPQTVTKLVYGPVSAGDPLIAIGGNQADGTPVNSTPYDANTSQKRQVYKLGDVIERKLTAARIAHVFHIHVNPFEVIKRTGADGTELIKPGEGFWRDTAVLLPNEELTVRMKLEDFTGLFVQHCHILDHEDLGMMDLVEIVPPAPSGPVSLRRVTPYPAPAWELPADDGALVGSAALKGAPTVLVFFEGFGCLRCNEQLQSLAKKADWFRERGVRLVAVSNDAEPDLRASAKAANLPFALAADPALTVFRRFGCAAGETPLHGVFVLDAAQKIVWQAVSSTPFTDLDGLAREVETLLDLGKVAGR